MSEIKDRFEITKRKINMLKRIKNNPSKEFTDSNFTWSHYELESDGYIEQISITESRSRLKLTEKAISIINQQGNRDEQNEDE